MSEDASILDEIPDSFWELIDLARRDRAAYRAKLKEMDRDTLVRFYHTFESATMELKDEPYVDHMNPELSEDGVDDVANWVVEQGKEHYARVINNPASVPFELDDPAGFMGDIVHEHYDRYDAPVPLPDEA
jgi:hypothetical protein